MSCSLAGTRSSPLPFRRRRLRTAWSPPGRMTPKAACIREFLTGLMEHLHVQAVPDIYVNERGYQVVLQGRGLGAIIGRRARPWTPSSS